MVRRRRSKQKENDLLWSSVKVHRKIRKLEQGLTTDIGMYSVVIVMISF